MGAIALLAYGALVSLTAIILRRRQFETALTIVSGGALALAFVSPVVLPEAATAAVIVPVLVVAVALPYLERERLPVLAAVAWVSAVVIAINSPGGTTTGADDPHFGLSTLH